MITEFVGFEFNLNFQARLLLDTEMYCKYHEEMIERYSVIGNMYSGGVAVSGGIVDRNEPEPEPEEEPLPEAQEVMDFLRRSKRAFTKESKSTDSTYIYGEYKGRAWELRTSDHDKEHRGYNLITTLKEIEFGKPLSPKTRTSVGEVVYSTKFKTTIKKDNGENETFLTSFVNEKN